METPFRGLVLGWYHQRNAGDDRLAFCIERWLEGHQLAFWSHTQRPSRALLREFDYVLLGGGSIANAHHGAFVGMRDWIAESGLPVWGVGLSVSSIAALREELRAIPESGGRIWARSRESTNFLNYPDGQCLTGPDLSWLFPLQIPHAPPKERGLCAVNFRPWPMRQWSPLDWHGAIQKVERPEPYPLCFGRDDDRPVLAEVFGESAPSFPGLQPHAEHDPLLVARAEMVVAMRFHAIIFAVQSGTPFLAIGNSKKLLWMLETLGLESHLVPVEAPQNFEAGLEKARALSRDQLLDLTRTQSRLAWQIADDFKAQIESLAGQNRAKKAQKNGSLGAKVGRRLRRFAP